MSKRGKFIALEGGEGSGKGTIMNHLMSVLPKAQVVFTREPGGTPLGEKIRELLLNEPMSTMTELLLFEAARAEHIERVIAPALLRGVHVICDRFDASTYAYQVRARWGRKHEAFFAHINNEVVAKNAPDLYLFCDIRPEIALARRMSAGGEISRFDKEEQSFHQEVYLGYKHFFANLDGARSSVVSIDAAQDISTMTRAAEGVARTFLEL